VKLAFLCVIASLCIACMPSEDDIRRDVRAQLAANPTTARLGLSVSAENRVVYLSGKTATKEEQQQAVDLAREVRGVKLVVNDMWVNNAELADKVKAALAADAMVGKIPIDVDAKGGFVRLMSDQTNREERARIVEIASAVEGVEQIEDRMK
jgi:hyperosmotically inducible periplasmic protein